MSAALRAGIVGCGVISERYLVNAPAFRDIEVVACADLDPAAARARSEAFAVRQESVDALLAAADVGLVINLTPPDAHFDVSLAALSAGKHVYSEKPLARNVQRARRLAEEARSRGLRLGCAPDTFLGGSAQSARAIVDAGGIGRVVGGTCHVMGAGPESWHPNPDFLFARGGGPVLDMGPYYVSHLVNLLGPAVRVTAAAAMPFDRRTIGSGPRAGTTVPVETPTTVHAALEFGSGALVTLGASFDVQRHGHASIELYGSDGSLTVPDPNFFGGECRVSVDSGDYETIPLGDHPFAVPNRETERGMQADYRILGAAELAAAIAADRPQRCSADLALHVLDVLETILRAAEERRSLEITSRCERPAPLGPTPARTLLHPPSLDTRETHTAREPSDPGHP